MKVSAWTLWLSAFGGAAAWAAALLVVPTIGAVHCQAPVPHTARFGTVWWDLVILTGAALVAACYALSVTARVLRQPHAGPHRERVRFMAFGGLLLNATFVVALLFLGAGLLLAPMCQ